MKLERQEILARIPHRPPFLFVDRVENFQEAVSATGVTTFRKDDLILQGHFPGEPIVPGVVLIECIAQVAAVVFSRPGGPMREGSGFRGKYFAKVKDAIFRKPVYPGETIRTDIRVVKRLGNYVKIRGSIRSGDTVVMEGEIVLSDADASTLSK